MGALTKVKVSSETQTLTTKISSSASTLEYDLDYEKWVCNAQAAPYLTSRNCEHDDNHVDHIERP